MSTSPHPRLTDQSKLNISSWHIDILWKVSFGMLAWFVRLCTSRKWLKAKGFHLFVLSCPQCLPSKACFRLSWVELSSNWNTSASNKSRASVLCPQRRGRQGECHSGGRPAGLWQQTQCNHSDAFPQSGVSGTGSDSYQVPTKWRCLRKWLLS